MPLFAQLDQQPDKSWRVTGTISPDAPPAADCPPGRKFIVVPVGTPELTPGTTHDGVMFIIPAPAQPVPFVDQAALLAKIAAKLGVT